MNRFFSFLAAGLCLSLLAACTTGPSRYVTDMQRFQGATEAQLVDTLGPPDSSYEVGGTRYLSYAKTSQRMVQTGPSYGVGMGTGNVMLGQGFGNDARIYTDRCDVFFAIRNHRVIKVGHRGNAC